MKRPCATQLCLLMVLLLWMGGVLPSPPRLHAGEFKNVNFIPMWLPQPQFAGYYMAKEMGIYERYGLDVTILDRGYDKDVLTSLKQGESDFGIMNLLTAIQKKSAGEDIVNVGQIFQKSAIEFVARKSSGIKSPRDFNGRKIALWRTVLRAQTLGFLKTRNIQAEVYSVDEGISFFLKRAVDIIPVMHYNEYNTLINHGIDPDELTLFRLRDFDMNFPEDGIYCLTRTYQDNPDLGRRFVAASMEGWDYAVAHPEEAIALIEKIRLKKNLITNPPHLKWMMEAMQGMIRPREDGVSEGHLARSDFEKAVDFLVKTQKIPRKVSYNVFYGNR